MEPLLLVAVPIAILLLLIVVTRGRRRCPNCRRNLRALALLRVSPPPSVVFLRCARCQADFVGEAGSPARLMPRSESPWRDNEAWPSA